LGNQEAFKAATGFAGGYADIGDICGAPSGGLMAIGLAFGRDKLEETGLSENYQKVMDLGLKLYNRFKKLFGSVRCYDIQNAVFGRHFNGENSRKFEKLDGYEKCANVVEKVA